MCILKKVFKYLMSIDFKLHVKSIVATILLILLFGCVSSIESYSFQEFKYGSYRGSDKGITVELNLSSSGRYEISQFDKSGKEMDTYGCNGAFWTSSDTIYFQCDSIEGIEKLTSRTDGFKFIGTYRKSTIKLESVKLKQITTD